MPMDEKAEKAAALALFGAKVGLEVSRRETVGQEISQSGPSSPVGRLSGRSGIIHPPTPPRLVLGANAGLSARMRSGRLSNVTPDRRGWAAARTGTALNFPVSVTTPWSRRR
jgi:hypothetical protein